MCYIDLEPCDVWEEIRVNKARKEHRCSCCRRIIAVGESYLAHFSIFEHEACHEKLCADCEQDRKAFAEAHDAILCTPGYLPEMLESCIADEPESKEKWEPMLAAIMTRGAAP
jgi:hypothetical protein